MLGELHVICEHIICHIENPEDKMLENEQRGEHFLINEIHFRFKSVNKIDKIL